MKTIFQAALEGPLELLKPVLRTLVFLIDSPNTRVFIRPHVELEVVISQFTDAYTTNCAAPASYPADKLQIAAAVIQEILATWTGYHLLIQGLLFFCVGDRLSIRAIIDALSLPNEEIRVYLL